MIEYSMLASGIGQRYSRPATVLAQATRLRAWPASPETCGSCSSLPATRVLAGTALCGRCASQRPLGHMTDEPRSDQQPAADPGVRGLAIVFGVRSEDLGFREIINRSAVTRNVTEAVDVRALWNHDMSQPIGRMSAGTLRTRVTKRGVVADITLPRSASSRLESVERRDVTGMSFAFEAFTDDWHLEDGEPIREVLDMRYHEVSPVAFPAYPDTTLEVVGDARSRWRRREETSHRLALARL